MADGSGFVQDGFFFPHVEAQSRLRPGEIVVDLFAGGGGASHALETALARAVDIAINHNPWAVAMHAANHPFTRHLCEDVFEADPRKEVAGRSVGVLHLSPDCTHFSQAKGGQPRSKVIRGLSWVGVKWAGSLRKVGCQPRILTLENVEQILKWGPLVAKRCKATRRVVKLDGTVAAPGERVPVHQQYLVPDKRHAGRTWRQFVRALEDLGYQVAWWKMKACDYGAGTSRNRLYMVARCDGEDPRPAVKTHGPGLLPYVTAADCIDWSIPCPSIFTRKKPLADATMRRIARGLKRYVLDAAEPFIVPAQPIRGRSGDCHSGEIRDRDGAGTGGRSPCANGAPGRTSGEASPQHPTAVAPVLTEHANARNAAAWRAYEPMRTQCANVKGGHFAVIAPTLVQAGYGEREGQAPRALDLQQPLGVVVAGGVKHAVVSAFLEQAAGGPNSNTSRPRGADEPLSTIQTKGSQQRLVTAHLQSLYTDEAGGRNRGMDQPIPTITGAPRHAVTAASMVTLRRNCDGADVLDPLGTVCARAGHHAVVEYTLSPEQEAGALRVAAFLMRYHSTGGQEADITAPLTTISTRDRLALVTVTVRGTPYVIVDIGLRMLQRQELFRAQGFPTSYIIDRTADGRPLTVSRSVGMCGNSVSPPPYTALLVANLDPAPDAERLAA